MNGEKVKKSPGGRREHPDYGSSIGREISHTFDIDGSGLNPQGVCEVGGDPLLWCISTRPATQIKNCIFAVPLTRGGTEP